MESHELAQDQNLPKVLIDEEIKASDCPYEVSVNKEGMHELFGLAGIQDSEADKITVKLQRKRNPSEPSSADEYHGSGMICFGEYEYATKTIKIYADAFWDEQEGFIKDSNDYLESGEEKHSPINWGDTPSRRRLATYLLKAPQERAKKTIARLAHIRTNRLISRNLGHETSHVADDLHGIPYQTLRDYEKLAFYTLTGNDKKAYLANSGEARAHLFQNQGIKVKPVSITPKAVV